MAKQEEFSYGSVAIPSAESKYRIIRWGWNGLNKTDKLDTGQLTDSSGVLVDPPYIIPVKSVKDFSQYSTPIGIFGFDSNLMVIYKDGNAIKEDVLNVNATRIDTGTFSGDTVPEDVKRTAVQFNVVDTSSGNIAAYTYDRRILVYPDGYSMKLDFTGDPATFMNQYVPRANYVTVYGSRVFGVNTDSIFCSKYNSYVDYNLDTAEDTSDANAWWSMSQSNTKADSAITAVTTYDNHVVVFKAGFMQLIYNNKNPFRLVDIGEYGCDNQYALAEMNGVLYFASKDNVYRYSGGNPKIISKPLEIGDYSGAVLGSFKDKLYMFVNGHLYSYMYNSSAGTWSDLGEIIRGDEPVGVRQFATLDYGIAALLSNGEIVFVDWDMEAVEEAGGDLEDWEEEYPDEWWFETDFITAGRLDIRRVKKLSLLCEAEEGAYIEAYLLRDGEKFDEDKSLYVGRTSDDREGFVILRVLTRQTSGYMHRIRVRGHGKVKIYAAELMISWGGDIYAEG